MSTATETERRGYGELWIGSPHGSWTERLYLKDGFPGGYQAAWQYVKAARLALLVNDLSLLAERGPCDAEWFPVGPGSDVELGIIR
jgi:hypothetical protein